MSKVKVIKMKTTKADNEDMSAMFNQMLGIDNINMEIAYPRYMRIRKICEQIVKLFINVSSNPFIKSSRDLEKQRKEIIVFCDQMQKLIDEKMSLNLEKYTYMWDKLPQVEYKQFAEYYEYCKKSDLILKCVQLCNNLSYYKQHFTNLEVLNGKFIDKIPGVQWTPFPFTGLNLKHIFSLTTAGENTREYFLIVLNKSYEITRKLYDELNSPDIDLDKFSEIIMSSIDKICDIPELNRCKRAMQKIKDSVSLLKNNFGQYYKDFLGTGNSTIMMEHFILDVAKDTKVDPSLSIEFNKIIKYYKKVAQTNIKDPKVKSMLEKISDSTKLFQSVGPNITANMEAHDTANGIEDTPSETISVVPRSLDDVRTLMEK